MRSPVPRQTNAMRKLRTQSAPQKNDPERGMRDRLDDRYQSAAIALTIECDRPTPPTPI
jgi:hypothetical protein